jgi:hypothetical protein
MSIKSVTSKRNTKSLCITTLCVIVVIAMIYAYGIGTDYETIMVYISLLAGGIFILTGLHDAL